MAASSGVRRILVADDDEMVLEVIRDFLMAAGNEVTATRDPQKAVELIWEEYFDVVLTDLGMPVVNGWAVAQQVKAKNISTPVILFTGWGAQYEEADLSKSGVDLVLSKPLDWKRLTDAVEELTTRSVSRQKECRKHWRFPGKKDELVKLSSPAQDSSPSRLRILDISRVGLSFRHSGDPNSAGALVSLDLIMAHGVKIRSVPCKVLYDLKSQEKSSLGQIKAVRRCGVQFEKLSQNQLSQLESYIRRRALDDAPLLGSR